MSRDFLHYIDCGPMNLQDNKTSNNYDRKIGDFNNYPTVPPSVEHPSICLNSTGKGTMEDNISILIS